MDCFGVLFVLFCFFTSSPPYVSILQFRKLRPREAAELAKVTKEKNSYAGPTDAYLAPGEYGKITEVKGRRSLVILYF